MFKKMSHQTIAEGIKLTLSKIDKASAKRAPEFSYFKPILVAVGKTKPVELILEAYEAGQRHFGENYVNELVEKATNPVVLEKCKDIKWHFIGHLQTNKINKILGLPNLYLVETVHSQKLATSLDKNWPKFRSSEDEKLKVMIQVNTSGEDEKNGVDPNEAVNLTKYVINECKNLRVEGLMTIGKYGYDPNEGLNPDYMILQNLQDEVCKKVGLNRNEFQMSMGMSNDFEQAIEMGSSMVRVGTAIFGTRIYKQEDKA